MPNYSVYGLYNTLNTTLVSNLTFLFVRPSIDSILLILLRKPLIPLKRLPKMPLQTLGLNPI